MHIKNRPPVLVPDAYRVDFERLSKAALMDMVWDYAAQVSGADDLLIRLYSPGTLSKIRHPGQRIRLPSISTSRPRSPASLRYVRSKIFRLP
jgi:hypothetical protein